MATWATARLDAVMQIIEAKVYNFAFTVEGITYQFAIPATRQQEAVEKLSRSMTAMVGELKALGQKAN